MSNCRGVSITEEFLEITIEVFQKLVYFDYFVRSDRVGVPETLMFADLPIASKNSIYKCVRMAFVTGCIHKNLILQRAYDVNIVLRVFAFAIRTAIVVD